MYVGSGGVYFKIYKGRVTKRGKDFQGWFIWQVEWQTKRDRHTQASSFCRFTLRVAIAAEARRAHPSLPPGGQGPTHLLRLLLVSWGAGSELEQPRFKMVLL